VDCKFIGMKGAYYANGPYVATFENCVFQTADTISGFPTAENYLPFSYSYTATSNSIGFWGGSTSLINCAAIGFDVGYCISGDLGSGGMCVLIGNTASRCRVGFGLGYGGSSVNVGSDESIVASNVADRCQVGFLLNNTRGGAVIANSVTGTAGPAEPANITNMQISGGTVTVTTQNNHNIPSGTLIQLSANLSGWFPAGNTTRIVTATVAGNPKQFTFASSNSSATVTGTWNYPIIEAIAIAALGPGTLVAASYIEGAVAYLHFDMTAFGTRGRGMASAKSLIQASILSTQAPTWGIQNGNIENYQMLGCNAKLNVTSVDFLNAPTRGRRSNVNVPFDDGNTCSVSDSLSKNFGDVVSTGMFTSAPSSSGTHRLFFTSVTAGIVAGLKAHDGLGTVSTAGVDANGHTPNSIAAGGVGSKYIDLQNALTASVSTGALVIFDSAGGTNHYKVRYDGTKWIRVG
jgi:hypothetical protein